MHHRHLAKAAYKAYGAVTGGKNYLGHPIPDWEDLGDTIQAAWTAVAAEVVLSQQINVSVQCGGCESGQEILARLTEIRSVVETTAEQINDQNAILQGLLGDLEKLQHDWRAFVATQETRDSQPNAEEQAALAALANTVGAIGNRQTEFAHEIGDQDGDGFPATEPPAESAPEPTPEP